MQRIYKQFVPEDRRWHDMPGMVVHFGLQQNEFVAWFVETDADDGAGARGQVRIVDTGEELDDDVEHIGTVVGEGHFVWHLVWRPKR